MMRRILVLAGTVAFSQLALAQPENLQLDPDGPVKRIRTVGEDGGMFYRVTCKNGSIGSVVVYDNPRRVCATPQYGKEKCVAVWKVTSAATHSCR